MNRLWLSLFVAFILVILGACQLNEHKKTNNKVIGENEQSNSLDNDFLSGKQVYIKYCQSCHQPNGRGVPNMYPPLVGTKQLQGDKSYIIGVLLNGLTGEIKVEGKKYNGIMASYRSLSDKEIADVLNYLRNEFGDSAPSITPDEVDKMR